MRLQELCDRGVTIAIALHDLNLAAQYCDRIILLSGGKIIAKGRPEDVINESNIHSVYGKGGAVYDIDGKPVVVPKSARITGAV